MRKPQRLNLSSWLAKHLDPGFEIVVEVLVLVEVPLRPLLTTLKRAGATNTQAQSDSKILVEVFKALRIGRSTRRFMVSNKNFCDRPFDPDSSTPSHQALEHAKSTAALRDI